MFDPFGDYESEGYLRNKLKEKDLRVIKRIEHDFFEANIEEALNFINKIHGNIIYKDFLKVHGILFSDIYPWAGKDRLEVIPGKAISKGDILFARPEDTKLAIDQGLRLAQDSKKMKSKLGEVMGFSHTDIRFLMVMEGINWMVTSVILMLQRNIMSFQKKGITR